MPTQTTTVTGQQSIPTELMPYFTGTGTAGQTGYIPGLLPKAQEVFSKDYNTQYGNPLATAGLAGTQRVAGLSPSQELLGNQITAMQTPGQFQTGYGAAGMGLGSLNSMLSPEMTQQYMSPYIQNVIDVNKSEAMRDAQKGLLAGNLNAARQGTYGGARQLLGQTEQDRNLQTKLGQIQAQGMQQAFDAAQKAQLGSATAYGALGDVLTRSGTAEQASEIDRLKTLGAYGDLERATVQQGLDARYQDFLKEAGYPVEQLSNMSNMLRGVPIAKLGESTVTTTPPPSFTSQFAGLGLSGLGMLNMLSK
jgi:hypothetical protein